MQNERMYDALRILFPDADPSTSWSIEQGPHTGWQIAITEWHLPGPQPTQSELDAVYYTLTQADALAAVEEKYESTFGRLRSAMSVAMLADGPSMDAKIAALRAEWTAVSGAQSAEIAAIIGG